MCSTNGVTEPRTSESTLEFPYSRSLGSTVAAFAAGLRDGRLLASQTRDGRLLMPPLEYDPDTGDAVGDELVEVGPLATVVTWTWVSQPSPRHPFDRPFAFALIKPDGSDTAMVHAIDVPGPGDMASGMRVRPRWRDERDGRITDIEAWEPAP